MKTKNDKHYDAKLMKPLSVAIKRLSWILDYPDPHDGQGIDDTIEDLNEAKIQIKIIQKYLKSEKRKQEKPCNQQQSA